jgi:hypothetical protein
MAGPLLSRPPTGVGSGLAVGQHFAHEIVPDLQTANRRKVRPPESDSRQALDSTDVALKQPVTSASGKCTYGLILSRAFFRGLLNREFATAHICLRVRISEHELDGEHGIRAAASDRSGNRTEARYRR